MTRRLGLIVTLSIMALGTAFIALCPGYASIGIAAPIIVLVFGGATGNGADALTGTFLAVGQNLVGSVFSSNILTSLADKIIGGFVALAIIEALPKSQIGRAHV